MHLILVHQPFTAPTEAGGTRHYELARALVRHGHTVTILAGDVSYVSGEQTGKGHWLYSVERTADGVEIRHCRTNRSLHSSLLKRLLSFISFAVTSFIAGLSCRRVDVICGTSPPPSQLITAWAMARLKRVPFIIELRDLWPDTLIDLGYLKHPRAILVARVLERRVYRAADMIVTNSPGFVPHLSNCGVQAERIQMIPNGVDPNEFDPTNTGDEFRRELGLGDRCIVMFAGTHGVAADLHCVLEAASLLRQDARIAFVLVGHGIHKQKLMVEAERMRLNNVTFVAPRPKQAMPQVLAAADICLAPLRDAPIFKTVLPNKVFDYMAAGRPVVVAIDGIIRKVVEGADAGLFVSPGDPHATAGAIRMLANDPELRRRLGCNGRTYVELHCSRQEGIARFEHTLLALANGPNRSSVGSEANEAGGRGRMA